MVVLVSLVSHILEKRCMQGLEWSLSNPKY
eukprot:SAG31_NODE_39780_length_285_cov_1.220430_1_plen_29_part_10